MRFLCQKCLILHSCHQALLNSDMINRELIRLKTVQIVYAYYMNDGKSVDTTEKELFYSLAQSYELYQLLLSLIVGIAQVARRSVEAQEARARRLGDNEPVSRKFADNRFAAQLQENQQLRRFRQTARWQWLPDEEDYLRRLYSVISARDFFVDYMVSKESSYQEDREIWRKIYRHVICKDEELDDILEGMNLYWNDDKVIVDTFVLKTIKRFEEASGSQQPLLPDFGQPEDREFASSLLRAALENTDYYWRLIGEQTHNWELNRIARMDLVVMQVALAEIFTFPAIPLSVSINEYVEITKAYSTPRSGSYVNGILDSLCHRLIREGTLVKEDEGETSDNDKQTHKQNEQ